MRKNIILLNLKNVRQRKQISQKQLSTKTKLSQSYISQLENNENANPTLETIELIANALDVCPLELLDCSCYRHRVEY